MKFSECDQFEHGSRKWKICRGEVELSHNKINRYREMWGMEPLYPPEKRSADYVEQNIVITFHGSSIDNSSTHKIYGPGTELLRIYEKAGVPHCDACRELAQQMNDWGIAGCRERIDEIVADILPRAKAWIADNKPWIDKLLPNVIEEIGIKIKVKADINSAIDEAEKTITERRKKRLDIYTGKKKAGCSSCGGNRRKQYGRPAQIRTVQSVLKPFPFTRKPKLNLLCHCWPVKNNWQKHTEMLKPVLDVFDRKIMGVVTDDSTDSLEKVKDMFGDSWEYFETSNDPKRRELVTYIPMMQMIESTDENEVTFCIHTKGTQQQTARSSQVDWWIKAMYETVVYNWKNVLSEMEKGYAIAGSFRRIGRHFRSRYGWHYTGTFYAFRNALVFPNGIPEYDQQWWGVESWPGQHFGVAESVCMFADNCGDIYKVNHSLEKELIEWRRRREN